MRSTPPPRSPGAIHPEDPSKSADAYRTIGEVAVELRLPQHVLRFWETRFSQIRPLKRAGGRRFYRPEDIALLRAVQALLYEEGYTIKGVQRLLAELGARHVADAHARSRGRSGGPADPGGSARPGRERTGDRAAADAEGEDTPGRAPAPPRPDGRATVARQAASRDGWIEGLNDVLDDLRECARLIAAVRSPEP